MPRVAGLIFSTGLPCNRSARELFPAPPGPRSKVRTAWILSALTVANFAFVCGDIGIKCPSQQFSTDCYSVQARLNTLD